MHIQNLEKMMMQLSTIKKQQIILQKTDIILQKYLFMAASLAEKIGKNKEAIELFKEIKEKYPDTQ